MNPHPFSAENPLTEVIQTNEPTNEFCQILQNAVS